MLHVCSKICGCKADLGRMLPQIDNCVQEMTVNSKKILDYQKQRQTAVWRLVEIAVSLQSVFFMLQGSTFKLLL